MIRSHPVEAASVSTRLQWEVHSQSRRHSPFFAVSLARSARGLLGRCTYITDPSLCNPDRVATPNPPPSSPPIPPMGAVVLVVGGGLPYVQITMEEAAWPLNLISPSYMFKRGDRIARPHSRALSNCKCVKRKMRISVQILNAFLTDMWRRLCFS